MLEAVAGALAARTIPGSPTSVPHGEAVHRELEVLVVAGLTPVQVRAVWCAGRRWEPGSAGPSA